MAESIAGFARSVWGEQLKNIVVEPEAALAPIESIKAGKVVEKLLRQPSRFPKWADLIAKHHRGSFQINSISSVGCFDLPQSVTDVALSMSKLMRLSSFAA